MSGPNEDCSRKRTADEEVTGVPAVVTVTLKLFEVPPPGVGFVTDTFTCPVVEIVPTVVIIVSVAYVAFNCCPPKFTTDVLTNPVPYSVSWNAPGASVPGVIDVSVGAGFWNVTVALACLVVSAWLVAVMVTFVKLPSVAGAV